eukprot:scaffold96777_cov63-Phaeocystis_antarctica.AAC.4
MDAEKFRRGREAADTANAIRTLYGQYTAPRLSTKSTPVVTISALPRRVESRLSMQTSTSLTGSRSAAARPCARAGHPGRRASRSACVGEVATAHT